MLPQAVQQKIHQDWFNWSDLGISVLEASHRSAAFVRMTEQAEADLRVLLAIPEHYAVLFMHGGGRNQFSALVQNLAPADGRVDYIITGTWSRFAAEEARKYVQHVHEHQTLVEQDGLQAVTDASTWELDPQAHYVHYCPNETIEGIAIRSIPKVQAPLVADMSSVILSEPLDVQQFGMIYAGAQKNIGPSGFSVVIIRRDLLQTQQDTVSTVMNYQVQTQKKSMYNTPNTFAWYVASEVFAWLKAQGGLEFMHDLNHKKAQYLYDFIDQSSFYINKVHPDYRSLMNVPFYLANPALEPLFLQQAEQQGLFALQGHRYVGGMRASIYNAMPYEGVVALVNFMHQFQREYT